MNGIDLKKAYSLADKQGENRCDIWLHTDRKTLILKRGDVEVGKVDLTKEKIALVVSNQDLFFEQPLEEGDITHKVMTELNAEIEIGVELFYSGPSGDARYSLLCGVGADDMRSGRMLQVYNLALHTVNLSIDGRNLIIEI